MFVHATFARFGPHNGVFGRNGTEREKKRDIFSLSVIATRARG